MNTDSTPGQHPELTTIAHLLDIDGTIAREHGPAKTPNPIAAETREAIAALHARGDQIMITTGTSWCLAEKIARALNLQPHPGLRRAIAIAADYGSAIQRTDGRCDLQVDETERRAFDAHRLWITRQLTELGAIVDDRDVRYQINAFWRDEATFRAACDRFAHRISGDQAVNDLFNDTGYDGLRLLRWQRNDSDFSVNCLPGSSGKANIVRWCRLRGLTIGVAAGDTGSDLPMLRDAEWPIVTIGEMGTVNERLADIVREKGRGHIATPDRPDGLGLADGINAYLQWKAEKAAAHAAQIA